jgi:colanic acid/amylovoran biosynthesis glycosyltransferase
VHAQPSPPPARERPRLLYVARLVPEKGHAVLMRALTILRARGHDAELVLVGDGPGRARLHALACELGLSDRLTFAGAVAHEQMPRQYAACSVFCLPSFSEGVPVVLMEAMACRVPVVASAVGGVRELVRDNSTGLLVSPGRPDQLAEAIARLLEHHELRARLGEAGRAHVLREFDIERSAAALEGIFEGLTAEGSARPQSETLRRGAQAPSSHHHAAGEALKPEAGALALPLESAVGQ